jgi:hypothetical protein
MAESDQEKGEILLQGFFPQQPVPENPDPLSLGPPLQAPPLTLHEVKQAIYNAKPRKIPGVDKLPSLVWQKLWPVVRLHIWQLYKASLRLGHVPRQW